MLSVATAGTKQYQYDEQGRLRQVTHGPASSTQYTLDAAGNRKQVTITASPGSFEFGAAAYSAAEGGGVLTIEVGRSGGAQGAVSVAYTTNAGTAAAAADFTAVSGTLSWGDARAENQTIAVPILDDAIYEGAEAFTIALSSPMGGATIAVANVTVTIPANDTPPSFSIASVSVAENTGVATFTVTKNGASALTHAVSYAFTNGTATLGSDYTATASTLTFTPTDATKTFQVSITADVVYENAETFTVTLSNPTNGATIGVGAGTATGTINNDDVAPSFSIANVTVLENVGTATFTVTRTGSSAFTHAVSYQTASGTATSPADFTAVSGTLSFASADPATKTIAVPIADDSAYESAETFTASLSGATNGATISVASAAGTILDDERGTLQLTDSSYLVNEAAGSITIAVSRVGGAYGAASVSYATAGASPPGVATAGSDYTAVSGTLTWADGDTASKSFSVPISNDTAYEMWCPLPFNPATCALTERFVVNLSGAIGAQLGAPSSANVAIFDNDFATSPGTLQFTAAKFNANESTGLATATISRTGGSEGIVSVTCSTSSSTGQGLAQPGSDFVSMSTTLTWVHGETEAKSCSVQLVIDAFPENWCRFPLTNPPQCFSYEVFFLQLSSPTGGATVGSPSSTAIWLYP